MHQLSLKKRIATVALSTVAIVGLVPSAASADTRYCGHTSTTHWGFDPHKIQFERHWWDRTGHQHEVSVSYFWGFMRVRSSHACN